MRAEPVPRCPGRRKRSLPPSSGAAGGQGAWGFPPFLEAGSPAFLGPASPFFLEHGDPCACPVFSQVLKSAEKAKGVRQRRETWAACSHVLFV